MGEEGRKAIDEEDTEGEEGLRGRGSQARQIERRQFDYNSMHLA
jgi:hypothetical protein